MKKRYKIYMAVFSVMTALFFLPIRSGAVSVNEVIGAAEAVVHFGSVSYEEYEGQPFPVGVYIESTQPFQEYALTITYDPACIEYVSGGTDGGDGQVHINGVSDSGYIKVMLQFRALMAGDMNLTISEAHVWEAEGAETNVVNQGLAPVSVKADQAVYLEGINVNGEELDVFESEILEYDITVPYETEFLNLEPLGNEAEISDQNLQVGENTVLLTLTSDGGTQTVYMLHVTRGEAPPVEPEAVPEENTIEETPVVPEQKEIVVPTLEYEDVKEGLLSSLIKQKIVYVPVLVIVLLVFAISTVVTYVEYARELERERRRKKAEERRKKRIIDVIDYDEIEKADDQDPIIVIDNICMDFKVATQNVSGVKEWMIEKIKGKISYRMLHALDHVSFKVYPGEVVGIIGTNGSGKSTLLKIISGALRPTSGHVQADINKIQLLTLGTGFDMELTARENVYLNGAIIGYSREFIDEHYDDIVEFAELTDFMEEKVKNFSSGMVSRLGFAIATAGDAAEILILDEVLSVGDEFFRKKSLARIKQMIHSGSTVLMVSHGMGTIRENCSKAVWIEKGKLRMIGEVKEVCAAYQKMDQAI